MAEKLTQRGKRHVKEMMERFMSGGLLRSSSGRKLDPRNPSDVKQALAILYSEARAGQKRGFEKRTWRGSTRTRPKLSR